MSRTLLLNTDDAEERRAALLEDGRLSLLWVEREDAASLVGDLYLGRVLHVEPSIGAAFVDLGRGRPGFLHRDDVMPGLADPDAGPLPHTPRPRPDERPPIGDLLEPGRELVVQVTRDALKNKGPSLTTYVSFPSRSLVLLPTLGRVGVSRRIPAGPERESLRERAGALGLPEGMGLVVRTSARDRSDEELAAELAILLERLNGVTERAGAAQAPALLHAEADFVARAVRELLPRRPEGADGKLRIVVDDPEAVRVARQVAGDSASVRLHEGPVPLFHEHRIERDVRRLAGSRVDLPGGAFLVIEETEALWAIDVNSGKARRAADLESTAHEIDVMAAQEVARQIRLRDLGGLIVVDFIDCKDEEHRRAVEEALREELARDPARLRVAPMSEFMLVEITRRRLRSGPARAGREPCPHCAGRGLVRSAPSTALAVLRDLRAELARGGPRKVVVRCAKAVAAWLEDESDTRISDLERRFGARIEVQVATSIAPDEYRFLRG